MKQVDEHKVSTDSTELFKKGLIPDWLDRIFLKSVTPIISTFSAIKLNPNIITSLGFLLNLLGAWLIVTHSLITAGLVIAAAGICDFVDGKVAAWTNQVTVFGAIYDSILDRYSDMVIYVGLGIYLLQQNHPVTAMITAIAMIGSVMTSYTKAVGEAHGFKFRAGCLRRQERITILCLGLTSSVFNQSIASGLSKSLDSIISLPTNMPNIPILIAIYLLAILSNITALQRLLVLRKLAHEQDKSDHN